MMTRFRCPLHLARVLMSLVCCAGSATWAQEPLFRQKVETTDHANKGGYVLRDTPSLGAEAQDTLQRINAYRAKGARCGADQMAAAPPLVWNAALAQAAGKHAGDMAARRQLSHTGGDGSRMRDRVARESYAWAALGENVSAGYSTVVAGLAGWMTSPGHCRNMMSPDFREVGVGAASAPGDSFGWYRAMVLGSPAPSTHRLDQNQMKGKP